MAIHFNNTAGFLLESGADMSTVLHQLSNATKLVKGFTRSRRDKGGWDQGYNAYGRPTGSIHLDDCVIQSMHDHRRYDDHVDDDEGYNPRAAYLYRQALVLPNMMFGDDEDHSHDVYSSLIVSIVTTFNLALVHQLQAEQKSDFSQRLPLLTKATKLYQLSFSMYHAHAVQYDGSCLYAMVLFNNLGLAYKEMRDDVASEYCFQRLLCMFMALPNTLPQDNTNNNINKEHWDNGVSLCNFFRDNITARFVAPPIAASAA
jgi:hypothetical protein